jgi:hypothetical protein
LTSNYGFREVPNTVAVVTRTRDELREFLDEQIEFLVRSNELFDQGHLSEAKRLAVTLRVLFHHTADSPVGRPMP